MARPRRHRETFSCPNCGSDVVVGKSFCHACGASDDSGWDDDEDLYAGDGYRQDEDDFEYEEFVSREFPEHATPRRPSTLQVGFVVVAILLVLAVVLMTVF